MGTVAVVLNATVVNVAIPSIMADFGMSQIVAQWLATGFLAAMTATMLASARIMERLGQRRTFMGALSVFFVACILAAASPNGEVMIFARVLQGAAAGVIQPLALVVIFQVFDDNERGRALGLYGMGVVLAPALGPAVGGLMIDWISWRAVYLPALPFCAFGLWGARTHLSNVVTGERQPFDWLGLALLCAGLGLLLGGLSALAVDPAAALWLILPGLIALALFVLRAAYARSPLITLSLFRHARFTLATLLALTYGAGLYASTYLLPLLIQGVQGMSATATGLVMMPAGLALAAIFPVSGRLADRLPAHRLILVGLAGFGISLFGVASSDPATMFVTLAAWILLGRVALGVMLPALNLDALRGLPDTLTQQGSGMINFARQLGGAFGVNLFALLLEARVRAHITGHAGFDLHRIYDHSAAFAPDVMAALTAGFRETFIVMGLLFVVAMGFAAWMGHYYAKFRKDTAGL